MKIVPVSILAAVALSLTAHAQVPVTPQSIDVKKPAISWPKTPEFQITGGANKRYRLQDWLEIEIPYETKPELIDELTFKVVIQFDKKLLVGEATYVHISKDRDHYAVVYVSPKSLKRLTGGKNVTPGMVENVWVEVSRQGQLLAKVSDKAGNVPNVQQLTGYVMTKDQTPFAPLYYDRYETLKPTR